MNNMTVSTISGPEFINLEPLDINPMMSKCEIKVLYVGGNRNGSFITEDVATEMAKTLRGAPIVGWYNEEKEDFVDHGDRITIDGEGIKFETLTKPYGFVSPDAPVWFQTFEEQDEFGNSVQREYLMTTGYLWTGQYEEAKLAIENGGRPQSMELDEQSLEGHWARNNNSNMEFFIINDAVFSKLCILGEDVEPCFEGAKIDAPDISTSFTLDKDFKTNLYNMMQELKFALEGGQEMPKDEKEPVIENFCEDEGKDVQNDPEEIEEITEDTSCADEPDVVEEIEVEPEGEEESGPDLAEEYAKLQEQYTQLEAQYKELEEFKNQVENEKKLALIQSFYMLSDEDKQDVTENMSKYSLDEIESKLSVICVRKKVNFNAPEDNAESKKPEVTTYTLDSQQETAVPAWISALRNTKNNRGN